MKPEVPPYEKNNVTREILSDIQQANFVADRIADEEIKMMNVLTKEHTAESKLLKVSFESRIEL